MSASAALDAVPAGELVQAEQVGVVEDEALRVLVGSSPIASRPGDDDLGDRLDRLGAPRLGADERIAIFQTDCRHAVRGTPVSPVFMKFGTAGSFVTRERGEIDAREGERRPHLADRSTKCAARWLEKRV